MSGNVYLTYPAISNMNYPLVKWLVDQGVPVNDFVLERVKKGARSYPGLDKEQKDNLKAIREFLLKK